MTTARHRTATSYPSHTRYLAHTTARGVLRGLNAARTALAAWITR